MARGKRTLCFIGLHELRAGSGFGIGSLEWCLDCGRTYENRYDGMAPFKERRYDLKFGKPVTTPTTEGESRNG